MTRAISRDSFNELKQYIGVHLQQGRVILDSDWNEGQDIMATLARRLGQDTFGDGVLGEGFEIQPVIPSPWKPGSLDLFELSYFQGHLPVSMRFPPSTARSDTFESIDGWALEGPGKLRISRDQPYEGRGFLRLSDHTGEVTVAKTLSSPTDFSAFQYAHFRFRLNHDASVPSGAAMFFIEDSNGNQNRWPLTAPWAAKERWFPGAALPLDLRFHLFDIDLLPAFKNENYDSFLPTFPTTSAVSSGVTFSIASGTLPQGLRVDNDSELPYCGSLLGKPSEAGVFRFTINATSGSTRVARDFTLTVRDTATTPLPGQLQELRSSSSSTTLRARNFWKMIHARPATRGIAANLSGIKKYGFIISPPGAAPAVWDFDALYFSSCSHVHDTTKNDFVIGGAVAPQFTESFLNNVQARDTSEVASEDLSALPHRFGGTPRAFVGGHPCSQPREILYSDQRDPSDPTIQTPLSPLTGTGLRKDLVYLDITREPVTYIEDPELREIALGGPDSSTRMRIRQRVRVAPDGALPTDSGIGSGTLATEGSYTDRSNRLYLVEVDTAGDIGTATVRWSDDNGSTLQRVIETIPSGSTKIKVEDASAFRSGDLILLRKEFVDEEHRVASVIGNTITLQGTGGVSTTFEIAHRPRIQRWNAFHAPVTGDPNDSTVSAPITLSFGVAVRIGGRALKKGDFWTFRTRYLAGDGTSGIDPAARIEPIDFQPPQGVVHHYAPLALIVRDPTIQFADRVQLIHDLRSRAGAVVVHQQTTSSDFTFGAGDALYSDFLFLGSVSPRSTFLCLWSGTIQNPAPTGFTGPMVINVDFYNSDLRHPSLDIGKSIFGASFRFDYNAATLSRSVSQMTQLPEPGIIAARVKYSIATPPVVGVATGRINGTLTLIEFKIPLQDMAAFGGM